MTGDLSTRVSELQGARKRCAELVKIVGGWDREVVTDCNVCGSRRLTVISRQDRYGLSIRAGLCAECGLVFLIDRLTAEGYSRFYRSVYRPLITAFLDRDEDEQRIRASQELYAKDAIHIFRGLVEIPGGGRLLDIGGSTGIVSTAFAREYGTSSLILDPSPDEVEIARRQGHQAECGLFEEWNGEAGSFDVILCARTIDHFLDLSGALRKMRRLIRKDGRLLIDIVDFDQVRHSRGVVEGALKIDHCFYLTSEIAPAILARAGWEVVISEIVSAAERVFYVCRPVEPRAPEPVPPEVIAARLRELQIERGVISRTRPKLSPYRKARLFTGRALRRIGLKA